MMLLFRIKDTCSGIPTHDVNSRESCNDRKTVPQLKRYDRCVK